MKAIAYRQCLPTSDPNCLIDVELPEPVVAGRDLLVRIEAISVNPVDTKVRRNVAPPDGGMTVLGYDAAGVVEAVGPQVTLFKPGDAVWYAGSRLRQGTNAQRHLVDERIVGHKPGSLDFAQAAAMPLTTITAWEALFDRLGLPRTEQASTQDDAGTVLITAGAGGVGSIAIQLARQLSAARILATASRPESRAQIEALGAHAVIDHSQPISQGLKATGVRWVERIFSVSHRPALPGAGEDRCASGPHLRDRRPRRLRCPPAQGALRIAALGGNVHPLQLRDPRHGAAGPAPQRGGPAGRCRSDQHHAQ